MKKQLTFEQALVKAAEMCRKVERCEADVRAKIAEWELSEDEVERIIKRLKDEKFLDNARFCSSIVRRSMGINRWGRVKMAYNLRTKKVEEKDIQSALAEISEKDYREALEYLIKTKDSGLKYKNKYEHRAKLYTFALSRGYETELINEVLKTIEM